MTYSSSIDIIGGVMVLTSFKQQRASLFRLFVVSLSILCVLLPNILFILDWCRFYVALPLILLLIGSAAYVLRQAFCENDRNYTFCAGDYIALLITMSATLLWIELLGIHGHVEQCGDWIHRNPIYQAFCEGNTPLSDAHGRYIVYYFAFWLPPAELYRALKGAVSQENCLFFWYALCFLLAEALLFFRIKKRILLYMGILFCFGSVLRLWYGVIPMLPSLMAPFGGTENIAEHLGFLAPSRTYLPVSSNIVSGPNHGIAMVLAMSLIMSRLLPRRYNGFIAALTIVCAPLNAIMVLPLLLLDVWQDRRRFFTAYLSNIPLWIAALSLIPVAAFYMCQETSSHFAFVFSQTEYCIYHYHDELFRSPWAKSFHALVCIFFLVAPCALLLTKRLHRTRYFISSVMIAIIIQCTLLAENELIYKGSIPMFMMLTMLFVIQLKHCSKKRAGLIGLFILLSASHVLGDCAHRHWWRYTWDPAQTRKNIRHGSLEELNPSFYARNRFPIILN